MKEIEIFTKAEKEILSPLYIAHTQLITRLTMELHAYKRALKEYKQHPMHEPVYPPIDEDFIYEYCNVRQYINQLNDDIEKLEKDIQDLSI